ncbi:hypothetical protein [Gemmatimonas sp.]
MLGSAAVVTFTLGRPPGNIGRRTLVCVWEQGQWTLAHLQAFTAEA